LKIVFFNENSNLITNIDSKTITNAHYLATSQLFVNNTQDADSMQDLILLLKSEFPDFLGRNSER